uniref:Secreted protein n=1 Tax=Attheya septentrionalis TaxID=420275 RepID=A0A7S2UTM9_9STRA
MLDINTSPFCAAPLLTSLMRVVYAAAICAAAAPMAAPKNNSKQQQRVRRRSLRRRCAKAMTFPTQLPYRIEDWKTRQEIGQTALTYSCRTATARCRLFSTKCGHKIYNQLLRRHRPSC